MVKYRTFLGQAWVRKILYDNYEKNKIESWPKENDSVVYMIISTKTSLTYVGETKNFLKRIQDEIRKAFNCTRTNYNYKNQAAFFEQRMGAIGPHTWSYIILNNMGKLLLNDKNLRLRMEAMYIQKYQPRLNCKKGKIKYWNYAKYKKKSTAKKQYITPEISTKQGKERNVWQHYYAPGRAKV